jgi:hypothetical protein
MKLLRVGHRVLNMDLVTDMVLTTEGARRVALYFAAQQEHATPGSVGVREIRLSGVDAEQFLRWLAANSETLEQPASQSDNDA